MDRKFLKLPFSKRSPPGWTCPTCSSGTLHIDESSFKQDERSASRDHSHEAFDFDWISYVFCTLLRCSNKACQESVALSGRGEVAEDYAEDHDGDVRQVYEDFFYPIFFYPPLKIFVIPDGCPTVVIEPIEESFRLFFASPSSAANQIRIAIEELLTVLRVKRQVTVKGKVRPVTLHNRILLMPAKYKKLAQVMIAMKWLGNHGSHGGKEKLSMDDVLDLYEFTEHILKEIYQPSVLEVMAKRVIKRKGPLKKT